MRIDYTRSLAVLFALVVGAWIAGAPGEAAAQEKAKSVQTEAKWVSFDADAKQITVQVVKAGRIKDSKMQKEFKTGREVTFDVKPEGSVLTRTTVKVNGVKGELADIPVGKTVNLYWTPDESQTTGRFARSIDVVMSEKEWNEKYGFDD